MTGELERVVVVGADDGPALDIVSGEGSARAVVWPGMGARLRSMQRLSLGPGARTVDLAHPDSDAVYYVIAGGGEVDDRDAGERQSLIRGSMVHVDAGTGYALLAGPEGIELVGGPSPPDPALYEAVGRAG